jgi:tetratricopeptide (TPR) repeat protein
MNTGTPVEQKLEKIFHKADGYKTKGKYQKRLNEELKAYELCHHLGRPDWFCLSLMRLGEAFRDMKQYEEAITVYLKSLEQLKDSQFVHEKKNILFYLIDCYCKCDDGDNMIYFGEKMIKEKLLTLEEQVHLYNQLSVNLDPDYYEDTIEMYLLKLVELLKDKLNSEYCEALLSLGTFYYEKKWDDQAIQYLEEAIQLYQTLEEPKEYLMESYLMLFDLYKMKGNQLKAHHYFHEANLLDVNLARSFLDDFKARNKQEKCEITN